VTLRARLPRPYRHVGPASIALNTADAAEVDERFARARKAGADLLSPLEDTPFGSHQFNVRDAEGNLWTVGTYLPEIPPTT
jgi:uncharacterized glyoxalase superfamily protein PhnB